MSKRNIYIQELKKLTVPKKKFGFKSISLFCGGGGLDLGFSLAGFQSFFSTDIDGDFCKTIQRNLQEHTVVVDDVNNLIGKQIIGKKRGSEFIILGGPPCQSFSILGSRKSIQDPRGELVFEYIRLINEIKPACFVFENVPGMLTLNGGRDWDNLLSCFKEKTKYKISWKTLNSADFGIPQKRSRIFIIGFKKACMFDWPEPMYADQVNGSLFLKPPLPAWMALEKVSGLPNHDIRIHGERVSDRYKLIKPGKRDKVDHTDRIHPDYPSGTVLVGSSNGGGRPFIHPSEPRHLTVREAARLQSFPDWWVFEGKNTQQYRQVGNAVPPIMAKILAEKIKASLI